ncbi:MAG: dipeptidase PepE [Alphaproteobacteria bacterium]|nr:dipeptidase PepE [Alphaproteobacteria bacterium]
MTRNLLLISNSTNAGEEYLLWPRNYIRDFFNRYSVQKALFIPYAGINLTGISVEKSFDLYEEKVQKIFAELGFELHSIHREPDPEKAVGRAEAIVIGGGNTFHLTKMMHEFGIMEPIRRRVHQGIPYAGWSAGANVACPTMKTTNDMPVSEPPSFSCLNLIPFQINPHYLDANPAGHAGETREQRILEFLQVNREITVAGLREGCLLTVNDHAMSLTGPRRLRVFRYGEEPREYSAADNLDFLLK